MANLAAPAIDKKQCFTSGLVEQLKARCSVKRVARPNPSLFIFIWESPFLAQIYKITFLVRVEANGEEALGFRFDDVKAETPREIAWGGMVGTSHSPRCFLDGSQTFLTDSIAKPSERCRRGWHVRIGKVSQILNLLETTQDTLAMKLSLRKLDSDTKVTNLVFRSPPSSALERFYQDTLQYAPLKSTIEAPSSNVSSSTISPITKTNQDSHHSIRPIRQPKVITNSTPIALSSQIPTNSYPIAPNYLNPSTSNPWTPSPPPVKSHKKLPLPIASRPKTPSTPSATVAPLSPQTPVRKAAKPLPLTPPSSQFVNHAPSDLSTFRTSNKPSSDANGSPIKTSSLNLGTLPKADSLQINPETSSSTTMTSENIKSSNCDATLVQESSDSIQHSTRDLVQLRDSLASTTRKEMVCFVFPPNEKRIHERKFYIPYEVLKKVDYFEQAIQSSKSTLSIDEGLYFTWFKTLKEIMTTSINYIITKCSNFLEEKTQLWEFKIGRKQDLIVDIKKNSLVLFISRISIGLLGLTWRTSLEVSGLILNELLNLIVQKTNEDDDEKIPKTNLETGTGILISYLRNALEWWCKTGLFIHQYLTYHTYYSYIVDDEEFEDQLVESGFFNQDQENNNNDNNNNDDGSVEPLTCMDLKATFIINHIGYSSMYGLCNYLQHGVILFSPIFQSNEKLELFNKLKFNENNDRDEDEDCGCDGMIGDEDLSKKEREEDCNNHNNNISSISRSSRLSYNLDKNARVVNQVSIPCNPFTIYTLSNRIGILQLKKLAYQEIIFKNGLFFSSSRIK